jgi:hypothetical protein
MNSSMGFFGLNCVTQTSSYLLPDSLFLKYCPCTQQMCTVLLRVRMANAQSLKGTVQRDSFTPVFSLLGLSWSQYTCLKAISKFVEFT